MDVTTYYELPGGGFKARTWDTDGGEAPDAPDGATEVTQAVYDVGVAAVKAANAALAQAANDAAQALALADYEALILLGVPEVTARRLSGYTGP